ncbi:hypothetical protein EDD17DRAFT_1589440 [Pisolithus thermaeus]|nr:hypothetical protein EDD17DRAFT_1589440 [Pisolithus thermaeus]
MYHYSSTCRMALLDDTLPGVVNDDFRIYGTTNLRIVGVSIFSCCPCCASSGACLCGHREMLRYDHEEPFLARGEMTTHLV